MKKILKLFILIFILASCNSITNIELKNNQDNISTQNSNNINTKDSIEKTTDQKATKNSESFNSKKEETNNSKDTDQSTSTNKTKASNKKEDDEKNIVVKVEEKKKVEGKNKPIESSETEDKTQNQRVESNNDKKENKPKDKKTNEANDPKMIKDNKGKDSKNKEEKQKDTKQPVKPKETSKSKEEKKPDQKHEKKPEDADVLKGLNPNRIYYDGSSVKYLDIGIDNYDIEVTQKYIDDGNVISTVTKFNPKDSEITYFSGHTYNYNNVSRLKISSLVTITDAKGIGYNYRIVDFKKYPAGLVEKDAPFIGGYHLIDLAGEGIGKESIVIQYCDEQDVPMIFFGIPE